MGWLATPGREPLAPTRSVASCAPCDSATLSTSQLGLLAPRVLVSDAAINCSRIVSPTLKNPRLATLVIGPPAKLADSLVQAPCPCRALPLLGATVWL